jgi:hypothetical protein
LINESSKMQTISKELKELVDILNTWIYTCMWF